MPNNEPTNHEILEAINTFADNVETRFDSVDHRLDSVEHRLDSVEHRLDSVEINMVTKEYLDDKLMDLKSDLVILMRKEDHKLNTLVDILFKKKLLTEQDKEQLTSLEPFPKSV
jgi:predicted  nucleic acid-binding Zn-ribbon protein